ncbi:hypothetical protein [Cohnella cellulosilytica]|uniref:Uncharacterized protein n=1 Tax=Cohnella cellulosilytica TaxID=986710 RepID=A0ABW2F4E4_9BACL
MSSNSIVIVYPTEATVQERLAARELRRYVYLRTSRLLPLVQADEPPAGASGYAVAHEGDPQQYRIVTRPSPDGRRWVHVRGGREGGMLYAAYRVAERLGVRFSLHGDIVPDRTIPFELPQLDESGSPGFELRGVLPFHDFPEGPDWWSEDDYKAVIAQLPKLKMNFFGLHNYPEKQPDPLSYNAEPGVWIGLPEDAGSDDGDRRVSASYPARHFTTDSEVWGFAPRPTGSYFDGAAELFERDSYGAPYMRDMTPWPPGEQAENELFDRFGRLLAGTFAWARKLGVRTCLGTETPLAVPDRLRQRLLKQGLDPDDADTIRKLYEGIFARIEHTHPLDYYWLWTPESWTWNGNTAEESEATLRDIAAAAEAAQAAGAEFELATCGWVLGPQQDRTLYDRQLPASMPFSCINRQFGFEFIDDGFRAIGDRPKWAIPWLEDDPALIAPQLWAGRMLRDAADAARFGCSGLMGIHWRTKAIDPALAALAQAGWTPPPEADDDAVSGGDPRREGAIGGALVVLHGEEGGELGRTGRVGAEGYRLRIPGGFYRVRLLLRPWSYDTRGQCTVKLSVYGQSEGQAVSRIVELHGGTAQEPPVELTIPIQVVDGLLGLTLRPIGGEACLCAIEVAGRPYEADPALGDAYIRTINCGGAAGDDWEADLPEIAVRSRHLPSGDFYRDWAAARFGPEAADDIAELFAAADGALPRPIVWVTGPGSTIAADRSPWALVSLDYAFLDRLEALRERVVGAGNLERFDYWLNQFRYLRSAARIGCELGAYEAAIERTETAADPQSRAELAAELLLPIRLRLVRLVAELNRHLLATVSTPGELGTVANTQQQALHRIMIRDGERLEKLLGRPLPPDARPSSDYSGAARMIVPTVRTSLDRGEPLKLTVLFLGTRPDGAAVHWRPMGEGDYRRIPLEHVNRGVYRAEIPGGDEDLEYYVLDPAGGLRFPATAGTLNQTVVRIPD